MESRSPRPSIKSRRVTAGEHARELFYERVASWWIGYRRNLTGTGLLLIWALSLHVAHVCWTRGAPDTGRFPLIAFLLFVGAPSFAVASTFLWLGRPPGPGSAQADAASPPAAEHADWEISLAHLLTAAPVGALLTLLLLFHLFDGVLPAELPLGKWLVGGGMVIGGLASVFHEKFWDGLLRSDRRNGSRGDWGDIGGSDD